MSAPPPKATPLLNALLALGSALFILVAIEIGARIVSGNYTSNFIERRQTLLKSAYPATYDPELGWVPKPGFHSSTNFWNTQITISDDGLRTNGHPSSAEAHQILTVGDSFTFGDTVSDSETWPAQLEPLIHRSVLNGGVFGYGLDQVVLRAKRLIPLLHPDVVILSLIPDDINRCELSKRDGANKPYFAIESGQLVLKNQPVSQPEKVPLDTFRRIFGYSYLVDAFMKNACPVYWKEGSWARVKVNDQGKQIAALLIKDWIAACASAKATPVILFQYTQEVNASEQATYQDLRAQLGNVDVKYIDSYAGLSKLFEQHPEDRAQFYHGHMTKQGNAWIAQLLADQLTPSTTSP